MTSCLIKYAAVSYDNNRELIKRQPDGRKSTPFDYGSGHVNLRAALNPGLVYDFDVNDVVRFLCSKGATPAQLQNLTAGNAWMRCDKTNVPSHDFNYPSIGVSGLNGNLSVHRTVTYYGDGPTVYEAYVRAPAGVAVVVWPKKLAFTRAGEKLSFRVELSPYHKKRNDTVDGSFVFGALTWSNEVHKVVSPISVNLA